MPLSTFQIIQASNDPTGASYMDSTAGTTYLVNELTDIKATLRGVSLSEPWQSLVGLQGSGWTGGLAWTFISSTQASIQGNQTTTGSGPTGYIPVGSRVRAFVTAGTVYGQVTATSFSAGATTVTFVWDSGALDSGLSDVQIGGDYRAVPNSVVSQTQAPLYAAITNSGSTWTGALTPAISTYVTGQEYRVKWGAASQGNDTVNLNSIGAVTVKKNGGASSLSAGDVPSGAVTNLLYDGTNFQLSGSGGGSSGTLYSAAGNPLATITNSTVETSMYSQSVPGNTLGINQAFRITLVGDFTNTTGSASNDGYTLKVKYGGTTFLTFTASSLNNPNNSNVPQMLVATIANKGVTNAQAGQGVLYGNVSGQASINGATSPVEGTVDTTSSQTLQITATLQAANTAITFNCLSVIVELI